MKTIVSLLLLSLSLNSYAQKIRFTDNRNEWVTLSCVHDSPPGKNNYKYYTDTFAYGKTYKQIRNTPSYYYCESIFGGACPGTGGISPMDNVLVREDTTTGKVYYRNLTTTTTDTTENLLYNYNAKIGDTIIFTSGFGPIIDTVAGIDSTLIFGVYHKVIGMQRVSYAGRYFVLEGAGCTNGPLFPTYFIACFEYSESLSCFSQSGIYPPIHSIPLGLCGSFATYCCTIVLDSFDNIGRCSTILSDKNINPAKPVMAVSPNPTTNHLTISTNTKFDNNTLISIYDITGKCVFRSDKELQNPLTINTSTWNNGLYLVIIQNNTGILKKEKIVISK